VTASSRLGGSVEPRSDRLVRHLLRQDTHQVGLRRGTPAMTFRASTRSRRHLGWRGMLSRVAESELTCLGRSRQARLQGCRSAGGLGRSASAVRSINVLARHHTPDTSVRSRQPLSALRAGALKVSSATATYPASARAAASRLMPKRGPRVLCAYRASRHRSFVEDAGPACWNGRLVARASELELGSSVKLTPASGDSS
jgi:hypothetical protein